MTDATNDNNDSTRTTIRWSYDERELLKMCLIEKFTEAFGTDYAKWVVTPRVTMQAQLTILPENRFRAGLTKAEYAELQSSVDSHIQVDTVKNILDGHKAYVAKWRVTPIEHALQLMGKVDTLTSAAAVAAHKLEATTRERDAAHKEILTLNETIKILSMQAVKVQPKPVATQKIAVIDDSQPPKVKLVIVANHLGNLKRALIDSMADVNWIETSHNEFAAARLAQDRHAMVNPSACSTQVSKAIRKVALSYAIINGGSSLAKEVENLVLTRTVGNDQSVINVH